MLDYSEEGVSLLYNKFMTLKLGLFSGMFEWIVGFKHVTMMSNWASLGEYRSHVAYY